MAAKKTRNPNFMLTDDHRVKIKNSNILKCLIEHVTEGRDMSSTQVTAGIALLRKVMPDLASIEHSGEVAQSYVARIPLPNETTEEWERTNSKANGKTLQ